MADTEQAQQKAQEVAGQAQQATGQAKVKVREQVDQRSTQAGEQAPSRRRPVPCARSSRARPTLRPARVT